MSLDLYGSRENTAPYPKSPQYLRWQGYTVNPLASFSHSLKKIHFCEDQSERLIDKIQQHLTTQPFNASVVTINVIRSRRTGNSSPATASAQR